MDSGTEAKEVLVVDDEVQIRRVLRVTLESAGYGVREAASGSEGVRLAALRPPDAILLDLGLPDMSGIDVLRKIREWSRVPILVLSVFDKDEVKISTLDAGADGYITKPFSGGELLARVRAALRRREPDQSVRVVKFGDVQMDFVRRVVTRSGRDVPLTKKEWTLLSLLAENPGKVITHGQIFREVWGPDEPMDTAYLRVYLGRLRRKLEENPTVPRHLRTESGVGYRLDIE